MTATYQYDAFGAVKTKTGSSANEWRFTGQLQDSRIARQLLYLPSGRQACGRASTTPGFTGACYQVW